MLACLGDAFVEEPDVDDNAAGASASWADDAREAELEAVAAALACFTASLREELKLVGIRRDLANPSRKPQSPPAPKPVICATHLDCQGNLCENSQQLLIPVK